MSDLISIDAVRELRDMLTPAELLRTAKDAARREMRGSSYSPDDRADVAARIVADILTETHGSMPARSDSRYSLTMICGRAATLRRSIERQRKHDRQAADIAADLEALSVDALAPGDTEPDLNAQTPTEAHALTDRILTRLGYALDSAPVSVRTLIYRAVRDADDSAQIGAEIEPPFIYSAATIDRRAQEARKLLAARLTAADLLRALDAEHPRREAWQWTSAPTLLTTRARTRFTVVQRVAPLGATFSRADLSRPAATHGKTWTGKAMRERAAEWRTGTAAGDYPTRPIDAADARSLCRVRKAAAAPSQETPTTRLPDGRLVPLTAAQANADALRRLGSALSAGQNDAQRERATARRRKSAQPASI